MVMCPISKTEKFTCARLIPHPLSMNYDTLDTVLNYVNIYFLSLCQLGLLTINYFLLKYMTNIEYIKHLYYSAINAIISLGLRRED